MVVSAPRLAFPGRVVEAHEPVGVQAFRLELAVQAFDDGVIGWLAGPGEVECNVPLIGPEIEVARDELGSPWSTRMVLGRPISRPTCSSTSMTSDARKLNRGAIAGEKREKVSTTVSTRTFRSVASWSWTRSIAQVSLVRTAGQAVLTDL